MWSFLCFFVILATKHSKIGCCYCFLSNCFQLLAFLLVHTKHSISMDQIKFFIMVKTVLAYQRIPNSKYHRTNLKTCLSSTTQSILEQDIQWNIVNTLFLNIMIWFFFLFLQLRSKKASIFSKSIQWSFFVSYIIINVSTAIVLVS